MSLSKTTTSPLREHTVIWLNKRERYKNKKRNNRNKKMFRKLLSNLPFNPSLIGQVPFYIKRLRQESSIRRTGLIFIGLTMVVQFFAVISPAQPTLASSDNDIIKGGFSSQAQAVAHCTSADPGNDFDNILAYYRVNCDILSRATVVSISSTDNGKALNSLGRNRQGPTIARSGKPTNEYTVPIGGRTYFMKNLWSWDSGSSSSYKVLRMTNLDGKTIMVMFNCGNIVTIGHYTPPPPPPEVPVVPHTPVIDVCPYIPGLQTSPLQCDVCPNVPGTQNNAEECYPCPEAKNNTAATACVVFNKTARNDTQNIANANGTTAAAGDIITYTLTVTNNGSQTIKAFEVRENLSDVLEYADVVSLDGGTLGEGKIVTWPKIDLIASFAITKIIQVRVKNPIPQTPISTSDPGSYDLVMNNVFYDKSINIKLPLTVIKTVETTTKVLPNTGPGTSLAIGFGITVFAAYFFARSRLFAVELDIVREDFVNTGGV